jgi:hypothetical protein
MEVTSIAGRYARNLNAYKLDLSDMWNSLPGARHRMDIPFSQRLASDPLTFIHLLLTVVIAWWALTLDIVAADTPRSLLFIMPPVAWRVVLTLGAVVGVLGLANRRMCRISTQVLSCIHGFIAIAFIYYNPLAPWCAPYAALAVFAGYLVWKRRT